MLRQSWVLLPPSTVSKPFVRMKIAVEICNYFPFLHQAFPIVWSDLASCKHIMGKVWRRNDRCVTLSDGICITRGWSSSLKSPPLITRNEINIKEAGWKFWVAERILNFPAFHLHKSLLVRIICVFRVLQNHNYKTKFAWSKASGVFSLKLIEKFNSFLMFSGAF